MRTRFTSRSRHRTNTFSTKGACIAHYDVLGALPLTIDGYPGVRFAVWAPNAERVSVVGDFNGWDGRRHPMNAQGASGIWCLFVPELARRHPLQIRDPQPAQRRRWL